jgi:WD40 repeat protein
LGRREPDEFHARLFDLTTTEITVAGYELVIDAALSKSGAKLALSKKTGRLLVFDAKTGGHIELLPDSSDDQMTDLRFSPTERYLLVTESPTRERIFDLDHGGQEISWLTTASRTVAFSANDEKIAATSDSGTYVYRTSDHAELLVFRAGTGRGIAFSPNGRYLAVGANDNSARVVDLDNGNEASRFDLQGGLVSAAFSSNTSYFAAQTDYATRVFDYDLGMEVARVPGNFSWSVRFSPDGRYVGVGNGVGVVFEPNIIVKLPRNRTDNDIQIAFGPDAQTISVTNVDDSLREFDSNEGHELSNHSYPGHDFSITADGKFLATGDFQGVARVFDRSSRRELFSFMHPDIVSSVALTSDGAFLGTLTLSGRVSVFDLANRKKVMGFGGADGHSTLIFGNASRFLFVSMAAGIDVVDVSARRKISTIPGIGPPFFVSPDNKFLAASRREERLGFFDIGSGKEVLRLDGEWSFLDSAQFSADGQKLAVIANNLTSRESQVRIYKFPSGEQTGRLNFRGEVMAASFQKDNSKLYVASKSGKDMLITQEQLLPSDIQRQACSLLTRNLTVEEWRQYFETLRYRQTCVNLPEDTTKPNRPGDTPTPANVEDQKPEATSADLTPVAKREEKLNELSGSLKAPALLSPEDKAVFNNYPRHTTIRWEAVPDASTYSVEIDWCSATRTWMEGGGEWCALAHPETRAQNIMETAFSFEFVGGNPGRWRVWAVDKEGREGPKSEYRVFRYTR